MIIFKRHELFSLIRPYLPLAPLIVEAGAYNGDDTCSLSQAWPLPGTEIHAFEPVPEIFALLEKNTALLASVKTYPLALSDSTGRATFFVAEKENKPGVVTQAGSLLAPYERLAFSSIKFPRQILVETIDLQTWAQSHAIKNIDLLWLDVQGMEYAILAAAQSFLRNIRVIYTEVGFYENYSYQKTYESFVAWITDQGFTVIGRDFIDTTRSFFGNIICVRHELISEQKGL